MLVGYLAWKFDGHGEWTADSNRPFCDDGSQPDLKCTYRIQVCDDGTFDISHSDLDLLPASNTGRLPCQPTLALAKRWCQQIEEGLAASDGSEDQKTEPPKADRITVTEEMVTRFLNWPLPKSVRPDPCVMDTECPGRIGTSLLTANEARQMLEHVLNAE